MFFIHARASILSLSATVHYQRTETFRYVLSFNFDWQVVLLYALSKDDKNVNLGSPQTTELDDEGLIPEASKNQRTQLFECVFVDEVCVSKKTLHYYK